jgi:hypothetical protein
VRVVAQVSGTASVNGDFTAMDTLITFADGDTTAKTVSIPILNDSLDEPTEFFEVALASPTGGAALGGFATMTVSIVDDDESVPPPRTTSGGGGALGGVSVLLLALLLAVRKFAPRAGVVPAAPYRRREPRPDRP